MATSEGIPSSIDIEFLELNDNPYITLLLFQSVNGYVVCIHTQGVASLALGYAHIGLSARPLRAGDC